MTVEDILLTKGSMDGYVATIANPVTGSSYRAVGLFHEDCSVNVATKTLPTN